MHHYVNNVSILVHILHNNADRSMNINFTLIVSNQGFFRTIEYQAFAFCTLT